MPKIPYWKYEGAGNDFVALDARQGGVTPDAAFVRDVCHRRLGIGADGVLVIEEANDDESADFRMVYFNADGSRGEMCGNGARCIAAFAVLRGAAPARMRFLTDAGSYRAEVTGDGIGESRVALEFPPLIEPPVQRRAVAEGRAWEGTYFVVGVPQFVTWVEDVERVEVTRAGRALRGHEAFGSRGTNVNFAQVLEGAQVSQEEVLRLRTYERGVEDETLACGSGTVATAWSHAIRRGMSGPVNLRLKTASGQMLGVSFNLNGTRADDVLLEGPARLVHEGHWLKP